MSVVTTVREVLRFWEFIDGYYLSEKNVDLLTMFDEVGPERTMNILESVLVEEAIRDGKAQQAIEKVRTQIAKMNGRHVRKRPGSDNEFDDVTETNPDEGWTVTDRDAVTGEWHEGLKVHDPSTFRLEPAADGSDLSPFG